VRVFGAGRVSVPDSATRRPEDSDEDDYEKARCTMRLARTRSQHDGTESRQCLGTQAGGLARFERYLDALKASGIIWYDRSLDGRLTEPQHLVPENAMPFEGIRNTR
jgi:cytochrome c